MQTNSRELLLCESKRRHNLSQNEHIGSDLGQTETPGRAGVMLMYSRWEDGCIYSEGSLHAAGHQNTDKLNVKCGWQICSWHCSSTRPIQPFLTHPPKPSSAKKFAQFCSHLPSFAHICPTADTPRPGVPGFCFPAAQRATCGALLMGGRGREQVPSSPGTHCSRGAHCSSALRGSCQPTSSFTARLTSTRSAFEYLLCTWHGR